MLYTDFVPNKKQHLLIRKLTPRQLLTAFLMLVVVVGLVFGLVYMSTGQDIRNQAYDSNWPTRCQQPPEIGGTISPVDGQVLSQGTRSTSLKAGPVRYHSCNSIRRREIHVRDVTDNEDFRRLCYYNSPVDENSFQCGYSGLEDGHTYEWYVEIRNSHHTTKTETSRFSVNSTQLKLRR